MNKSEFSIFANVLRTTYSSEKILPNEEAMNIWYEFLNDIPYEVANVFLRKWIVTEKWSPKISEIRAGCSEIMSPEVEDYADAWDSAMKAISKYGRYEKKRALNSLKPLTRKVVEYIGYECICDAEEDNITNIRAQFRNCYNTYSERNKVENQTPTYLKSLIDNYRIANGIETKRIDGTAPVAMISAAPKEDEEYSGVSFDDVERNDFIARNIEIAEKFVANIDRAKKNLLFWGASGTGKTMTAACIKNALEKSGKNVKVIRGNSKDVQEYDLVIVDCPHYPHQAMRSIEELLNGGRRVIVVSGMTLVNMQDYPDADIQDFYKRLIASSVTLQFTGKSYREKRAEMARDLVRKATGRMVMGT